MGAFPMRVVTDEPLIIGPLISGKATAANGKREKAMKRASSLLFVLLAVLAVPAQASARDAIEGDWRNHPDTLVVRISECGGAWCGTVVKADQGAKETVPNIVGTKVLTGLRRSTAETYTGEVFNPNLNIHAAGTVTLVSPTVLVVRACVLGGLICKQQHWMKIS